MTQISQNEKAASFRQLHFLDDVFVMPNAWDIGSARILQKLGFKALGTTSSGMAFGLGKIDGTVSTEETFCHCSDIVSATPLPVSADLREGFGDSPEEVYKTIIGAAKTGVVGGSIEDWSNLPGVSKYEKPLAVERIKAASEAVKSLSVDFMLTARCEVLDEDPDLGEIISRLNAFDEAGADVLYAPGLEDLDSIRTVISEIEKPFNVLMMDTPLTYGIKELASIGVKRVSVGSVFTQLAYGSMIEAAQEIVNQGSFGFIQEALGYEELERYFK